MPLGLGRAGQGVREDGFLLRCGRRGVVGVELAVMMGVNHFGRDGPWGRRLARLLVCTCGVARVEGLKCLPGTIAITTSLGNCKGPGPGGPS